MQLLPYLTSQSFICLKISGQAFGTPTLVFNDNYINSLAQAFAKLKRNPTTKHIKFVVIVGAGNIWRGKNSVGRFEQAPADYMGMIATNLNAIYLREQLKQHDVRACMLSALAIDKVVERFNVKLARQLLAKNDVLIISSGTGLPFVTTDSATEKYAYKLGIKTVIMGKNGVECLYNQDPGQPGKPEEIKETTFREILQKKLLIIDLAATKKYINSGVCAVIMNINDPQNLVKLFMNNLKKYSIIIDR